MKTPPRNVKADTRPVDPHSGKPIGPMAQPGYYLGFSTLRQQKFWDAKTREVILDRVNNVPKMRYFGLEEGRLLKAICDHVIPQDDRDESHKIPIAQRIDERLYDDLHDGYRYEGMPPDREAFRLGLQAIEELAQHQIPGYRSRDKCSAAGRRASLPGLLPGRRRKPNPQIRASADQRVAHATHRMRPVRITMRVTPGGNTRGRKRATPVPEVRSRA
jgi:Gluconate 2-dehydrogenase subunit 3